MIWRSVRWLSSAAGCLALAMFVAAAGMSRRPAAMSPAAELHADPSISAAAQRIDALCDVVYARRDLTPLGPADFRVVARRLALALQGRVPSLEELLALERAPPAERLDRYAEALLGERRYADYFAERLARALVPSLPTENIVVFRRNRFVTWLGDQLALDRPYGEIVRQMISDSGLWTERPATNFISSHDHDPQKLTTRTTRAFLGLRLDCAQCHDHPFAPWKQSDFHGLAAYYAHVRLGLFGIADRPGLPALDEMGVELPDVKPAIPFDAQADPREGTRRQRLAQWITRRDNRYFGKAIANRCWRLMLGRGLVEPVDDLERPEAVPGVLEILADDFQSHGQSIRRLLAVIARTAAFRRQSEFDAPATTQQAASFAAFPATRLLPAQLAGALVQVSVLRAATAEDHWFFRLVDFANRKDFAEDFGDRAEDELEQGTGNLRQRLVLMNGRIVDERLKGGLFHSTGRLAALAASDHACLRLVFLTCLAREPRADETEYFAARLADTKGGARTRELEDLMWALLNSSEFSWSH